MNEAGLLELKENIRSMEIEEFLHLHKWVDSERRLRIKKARDRLKKKELDRIRDLAPGARVVLISHGFKWKPGTEFTLMRTRRTRMTVEDEEGKLWSVYMKDFGDANSDRDQDAAKSRLMQVEEMRIMFK